VAAGSVSALWGEITFWALGQVVKAKAGAASHLRTATHAKKRVLNDLNEDVEPHSKSRAGRSPSIREHVLCPQVRLEEPRASSLDRLMRWTENTGAFPAVSSF
jgi:hypothetical protein